ncbi:unnamed protein product [Amoebophrya sp. A25]|nr:unnamed protein product [Amoebophrya sp. A25]|eukprot:GSA25T00009390001.1
MRSFSCMSTSMSDARNYQMFDRLDAILDKLRKKGEQGLKQKARALWSGLTLCHSDLLAGNVMVAKHDIHTLNNGGAGEDKGKAKTQETDTDVAVADEMQFIDFIDYISWFVEFTRRLRFMQPFCRHPGIFYFTGEL